MIILVFLLFAGKLGGVLEILFKFIGGAIIVLAVITVAGLFILNHLTSPKAVATVTNVINSDVEGAYFQRLTVKYTYKDKEYVVDDIAVSSLLAEVGDKYYVHFSNKHPDELKHIEVDDKVPTTFQQFKASLKYAVIGIIVISIIAVVNKDNI